MEIGKLIERWQGKQIELHRAHVNPALARVLQIIDYDVVCTRGEGARFYDVEGNRISTSSPAAASIISDGVTRS